MAIRGDRWFSSSGDVIFPVKSENATSTYRTIDIELQKGLRFNQACNTSC
jgi:hypothetical protein